MWLYGDDFFHINMNRFYNQKNKCLQSEKKGLNQKVEKFYGNDVNPKHVSSHSSIYDQW